MRRMFFSLLILPLFISCQKVPQVRGLAGSWELIGTELYENGNLNGTADYTDASISYQFETCTDSESNCLLTITTDGARESHAYKYDPVTHLLSFGVSLYEVELLNDTNLIFFNDYPPYRSRYIFKK